MPFRGSEAIASGLLKPSDLRGRRWQRVFRDVYVAAGIEVDHRMLCTAGLLATRCDTAAISGVSAAYLFGIDLLPLDRSAPVEITVPSATRIRIPGIFVVRTALAPADVQGDRGITMTGPERTAFDLARRLPRLQAVAAIDALLHRHVTTVDRIRAFAFASTCRPGRSATFDVLPMTDLRSESLMESILRVTLVDWGLPRPECQVDVFGPDGVLIGRLDFAYRRARVGIEYEGDHHRDRATFQRDLARINALQATGWTIVRASARDIRNPAALVRQIGALLDRG